MNILVLGGGISTEREVSLRSAEAVRQALINLGHTVVFLDPNEGLDKVEETARSCDLVLPILHGRGDEDGVQEALDRSGTPYLGAGAKPAKLCMDKVRFKDMLSEHGIATPTGETVTLETFSKSPLATKPFVLKPVDDGSSLGLLICRELPYDAGSANELLKKFGHMLLEEFIDGIEITVAILDHTALPVIEIVPQAGKEFDYENKYNGSTSELCPPENVDEHVQRNAQELALRVTKLAGVRHLSRTDMIVKPNGSLVVLETNTLPGLTETSLYPKAAATAGLSFDQMIARFVELASN